MDKNTNEKNLYHEAVGLFMCTDRLHKKVVEKRLEEIKLHRSQHVMLMHLHRFGKAVSQKELAESLSITPAAAAVSVKKLIDGGYIERKTSDKDARYNDVTITEKGRNVVMRSREIFDSIDKDMVEGVAEEELIAFIGTLKKMKENLIEKGQIK